MLKARKTIISEPINIRNQSENKLVDRNSNSTEESENYQIYMKTSSSMAKDETRIPGFSF